MAIDGIIKEISHIQRQIKREQGDIRRLKAAGIDTAAAELLLGRMHAKLEWPLRPGRSIGTAPQNLRERQGDQRHTFLANHYEDGEQVFLFSFSRGAYTVRVIAGLVHRIDCFGPTKSISNDIHARTKR
jgi:hypothetical protein